MRAYGYRPLALGLLLTAAFAAPAIAATVTVSPSSVSVPMGGERRLTAYVNGRPSAAVTWTVDGSAGGNAAVGFIDATGKYTAPASATAGSRVTAKATTVASPAASGTCVITLRNQIPWVTSLSPKTLALGSFTVQVAGSRFVSGAQVRLNGVPLATTFNSPTQLTASGTARQAGFFNLSVANPGPGAVSPAFVVRVTADRTPTRTATQAKTPVPTRTATRVSTATPRASFTRTPGPTSPARTATTMPTATRRAESTRTMAPTMALPTRTATTMPTATARSEPTRTMAPTTALPARTATMMPTATAPPLSTRTMPPSATASAVQTPIQDPLALTHGRLLDQATFGPTRQLGAHLAQIGIAAFIEEQLAMAASPWPSVSTAERGDAVEAFFANALNGQDQLRQRVIYALSEIIVESMNKNTNGEDIVPWLQLLSRNAFGNYRTLLEEITLDASMGKFLDLANSGIIGGAPNENYPREVMQLFSIGLYQLNLDGSVQLNAQNVPIPTYTQTDVQQLAKALTGWTYGNPSGTPPGYANSNYYPGPMLPVAAYHNKTAKTILGQTLAADQSAQQDLDGAIDIIFQHPNVGPFLATRLIRALVTSNPSPAYVARVATAFNGTGVRGDMKAVIRAILLDPEARNDTPPANFGRLRTPMQHTIALARALALNLGAVSQFAYLFEDMHEGMLDAPSVFGHYSPMYRIPMTGLFAPEFQIYSASDAINRANLFYWFMYNPWPINPALQPFVALAGNAATLVSAVDNALLFGRMLPATRAALLTALPAMPDNNARVLTAVYLTSMSGEYLVQR